VIKAGASKKYEMAKEEVENKIMEEQKQTTINKNKTLRKNPSKKKIDEFGQGNSSLSPTKKAVLRKPVEPESEAKNASGFFMTNPGTVNDNNSLVKGLKKVTSGNLSVEDPSTQRENLMDDALIDDHIDYISLFKDEEECLNIMRQIESDNLVKIHELQTLEQDITIQTSALNKASHDLKAQLSKLESEIME